MAKSLSAAESRRLGAPQASTPNNGVATLRTMLASAEFWDEKAEPAAGGEVDTGEQDLELLRRENAELRAHIQELCRRQEESGAGGDQGWEERQREFEGLLEEKSEVIRSLHQKIQELQARPTAPPLTPREDELIALSDELERMLRGMPALSRQVFELRLQGYHLDEIAAATRRSVRSVSRVLDSIKQELERGKKYSEKEAVEIVIQIAQALQHAHRRGLIHRDIKPANIILTPDGIAKLADLGMARETEDKALARAERGMTIGTPFYIAPEQIRGIEDVDDRADIYSLGATLYHMVTGQPPFPGSKVDEVLKAQLETELTPPDHLNEQLSAGLGEVVEFMMAKERSRRYRHTEDLIIDLECLLNGEPPKLVRQRIQAATLRGLAEGEAEDGDRPPSHISDKSNLTLWITVLAVLLGLSVVLNLVLMLIRV